MNICFFDTETTGKPKNYKAHMSDVDNWPRVTQLAYIITDPMGRKKQSVQHLILPDGWTVPKEDFFIRNNMSTERCQAEGVGMDNVLDEFVADMKNFDAGAMVAHNINFDYNVLGAEMIRYNRSVGRKLAKACTMVSTTNILRLPGKYGLKFPSLAELHLWLFNEGFEKAHDAMADVEACARCYHQLVKQRLIDPVL